MNWTNINGAYFNTNNIVSFYWKKGRLYVWNIGDTEPEWYEDKDRANYLRLCRVIGVRPVEEDADGQG
jgi:hypothetical protein